MKKQTPKKLEIFLLLALRRERASKAAATSTDFSDQASDSEQESGDAPTEIPEAFAEQLSAADRERFERLLLNYRNKPDAEKQRWRERTAALIGDDGEFSIDEHVHRSHVEAALAREIAPVRRIVSPLLASAYKSASEIVAATTVEIEPQTKSLAARNLEKTVRRTFAAQFVARRDLPKVKAFDNLSGAQLARLVRIAGIREIAFACARIKAVEAVGAFLRRFAPEDARAIAAQLSVLPKASDARLAFAEALVGNALEIEPQPSSAMLDWLGVRLVAILLGAPGQSTARAAYAEQKLPLEAVSKFDEIIEAQRAETPGELKEKIGAEIEKLAETVAASEAKTR